MIRKIIHIDEEKCNGCGLCASACHEGAIELVDGKAKLVRENFCDGFGDCLLNCPVGAISFEEMERGISACRAAREMERQRSFTRSFAFSTRPIDTIFPSIISAGVLMMPYSMILAMSVMYSISASSPFSAAASLAAA